MINLSEYRLNTMLPLPPQVLVSGDQLGHLLRSTRKRLKLSQTAIAGRLNLSQNRVSYLELHPDALSFSQLLAWCAVLGLDLRLGTREVGVVSGNVSAEW